MPFHIHVWPQPDKYDGEEYSDFEHEDGPQQSCQICSKQSPIPNPNNPVLIISTNNLTVELENRKKLKSG